MVLKLHGGQGDWKKCVERFLKRMEIFLKVEKCRPRALTDQVLRPGRGLWAGPLCALQAVERHPGLCALDGSSTHWVLPASTAPALPPVGW